MANTFMYEDDEEENDLLPDDTIEPGASDLLSAPPEQQNQMIQDELDDEIAQAEAMERDAALPLEEPQAPTEIPSLEPQQMQMPQDDLSKALDRRRKMLRDYAILRGAIQAGQGIAGKYSGQFKPDYTNIENLEKLAGLDVEDFKTKQQRKEEEASRGMYEQILKQANPQLEISKDVPTEHLKNLIKNFQKASRTSQQSQYMTSSGDPLVFDPNSGKYYNALTGEIVTNGVIRNYIKTITDKKTGEDIEVRPGVGFVRTIEKPSDLENIPAEQKKEITREDLNPDQRKELEKSRNAFVTEIKDDRDAIGAARGVQKMLDLGEEGPLDYDVLRAIQNQLARASGERGAMTNRDVEAFGGRQDILSSVERWLKMKTLGQMPEEDRALLRKLASKMEERSQEYIKSQSQLYVNNYYNDHKKADNLSKRNFDKNAVKLLLGVDAAMAKPEPLNTPLAPNEVRRIAPDGRVIIYDKETKKPLREEN